MAATLPMMQTRWARTLYVRYPDAAGFNDAFFPDAGLGCAHISKLLRAASQTRSSDRRLW